MKPVDNWKRIARRAWSVRLMLLAGLLSGCEAIVPLLDGVLPRRTLAVLTFVVVMGALVARFVAQRGMKDES